MQQFSRKIVVFIGILLVVNTILNVLIKSAYIKDYNVHSTAYSSYLFADSHGLPLQNTTESYGVYNFSGESDSYFDIARKLSFLLKSTQIDTIYLSADAHHISTYREMANNLDRSIYYTSRDSYTTNYEYLKQKLIIGNIAFFQPKARTVLKHEFLASLKNIMHSKEDLKVLKNNSWELLTSQERIDMTKKRIDVQFPKKTNSKSLINALLNIIDICKKNEIHLIGIKFPLTKEYLENVTVKNFDIEILLKQNGFTTLDFSTIFENKTSVFRDQDHLNFKGGALFTDLVLDSHQKE